MTMFNENKSLINIDYFIGATFIKSKAKYVRYKRIEMYLPVRRLSPQI